jgi:hypothetical protein
VYEHVTGINDPGQSLFEGTFGLTDGPFRRCRTRGSLRKVDDVEHLSQGDDQQSRVNLLLLPSPITNSLGTSGNRD